MNIALVNGVRTEAQSGLAGQCPLCGKPTIAKCGAIRIPHWAHRGKLTCDPWKEPKGEWHLNWQKKFPVEGQEVIQHSASGEKHIADVKTEYGWVLEFQHSPIAAEERRARDDFYSPRLVWIVDGAARKRDLPGFLKTLQLHQEPRTNPFVGRIFLPRSHEGALLRDWAACRAPVFFDFGENDPQFAPTLYCLLPKTADGRHYVAEFSRAVFVEVHRRGLKDPDHFEAILGFLRTTFGAPLEAPPAPALPRGPINLPGSRLNRYQERF